MMKLKNNMKALFGRQAEGSEMEAGSTRQLSMDSERPIPAPGTSEEGAADVEGTKPPAVFCCPISFELMHDPVVVATGHTYDREFIQKWLETGHRTCPVTGVRLRHNELMPNFALRNAIRDWATAHGVELKPADNTTTISPGPADAQIGPEFSATELAGSNAAANSQNILQGHEEIVWAMEVSGRRLFSASADKTIRVWDIDLLRCVQVLEDHTRPVLSLAVTVRQLFSGSYDCTIRVWDLDSLSRVAVLEGHTDAVRALAVAGGRLFSGSYDNTLRVWDLETLQCARVLQAHRGPVRTLVTARARIFSGSYDHTVCVWDVHTLEQVGTLKGHTEAVRALAAGGRYVFSGSDDTCVRVWDAETLECCKTLRGHHDNVRVLAVCRTHLFSGSWDKTIRVWDLEGLECCQTLHGHAEAVLALTIARGHLVSGSYDMSVRYWDLNSFRCVRKCEGHIDAVRVLTSAGENAEQVFSGSYDGSIGCWVLPPSGAPSTAAANPSVPPALTNAPSTQGTQLRHRSDTATVPSSASAQ
mmetsp:Transcript_22314/g.26847  ORF Transcript_22314/g.26847 Transcript_22314/m.26847 type:complete len:530 (+) Transcript_22314:256-1845(+)|eukprot:CAMPEP_0197847438 /NCGR_PEP_ID=MMETSP1438-20131217/6180_1 /TAXON_ID=1461541 /ORGANISM="Pterosperma sp., Strain CCMP1384" /LENGTH=529 /DNA_ID=CAMNT_0043459359 /DNA_START=251 /DNA_END=1840 /DNA_ORIENTATION=+